MSDSECSLPKKPPMRLLGCTCPAVPTTPCPLCGLAGQAAKAITAGQTGHCFISAQAWQHQRHNPKIWGSGQRSNSGSGGATSSRRDPPSPLHPHVPWRASLISEKQRRKAAAHSPEAPADAPVSTWAALYLEVTSRLCVQMLSSSLVF